MCHGLERMVHGLEERKGDHEGVHSVWTHCFPLIGIHGHLRIACMGLRLGTNARLLRPNFGSVSCAWSQWFGLFCIMISCV
jgi:hypothetical protein